MRLFMDGEWFDALPPTSVYENEFEGMILGNSGALFPGFYCFRFDPLMVTPHGAVKPDLALIDTEYRSWYIVEVEMASHSVTRHVRPQMERIDAARPDQGHSDWLADRHAELDRVRLRRLMLDVPHGTVLLVNAATPHWDDALRSLPGVQRAVVEVFRSRLNRTILRINGQQPHGLGQLVSHLLPGEGVLARGYKMEVPSALPDTIGHIDAVMGGDAQPSRFRVKVLGGDKYLFPTPAHTIEQRKARLMVDESQLFRIED